MAGQHRKSPHLKQIIHNLVKRFYRLQRRLRRLVVRQVYHTIQKWQRRQRRMGMAGFVLPTTTLLLLVIALTVGAIIHRAYSHTNQIIGESQQRVIYNAASPAIDRARAKLESMFDPNRDNRYPGGIPSENHLAGMLRNDGSYGVAALPPLPGTPDIYTLPGETRINLDGTTKAGELSAVDNAWAFRTDTNGDGNPDATVVYSILLQTPRQNDVTTNNQVVPGSGLLVTNDLTKAQNLWVRTAPLSNRQRGNCSTVSTEGIDPGLGWFQDSTSSSILRKNFQIDAIVIPDTANTRPNFVTLEMQQDRQLDRGNKWGAWFRNDMEIYPGAPMNWNGAMHTEGNLIVGPGGSGNFHAYLVSAKNSCLMSIANNSEITVTNIPNSANDPNQKPDFLGGVLHGSLRDNNYGGNESRFHLFPAPNPGGNPTTADLTTTTDSATGASPALMALDPIALLTRDVSLARDTSNNSSNRNNIVADWKGLLQDSLYPRITNQAEPKPYVDDLYRADDRWGPKPRYSDNIVLRGANQQPGNLITNGNVTNPDDLNTLINTTVTAGNITTGVGLDGYWERRAIVEGMRVIVGQRLELGNSFGWTNTDPMYPPNVATLSHEQQQRRTMRDNPASVQGSAIYHVGSGNANFPVACLASTAHPGSLGSLTNSITFNTTSINGTNALLTDFLMGYGTNGWEFAPPAATESDFAIAVGSTQPLGKALRNLANFAGDPDGAFPPRQEVGRVHPYPNLTMWGNYSELRRTLARLDSGVAYSALSPADKTNLHTAACTLGMLSYNIATFQNYDYANSTNAGNGGSPGLAMLGNKLFDLVDGKTNNGEVRNPATGQYFTFTGNNQPGAAYYNSANPNDPNNGPNTYSRLPPQAFITALLTEPIPGLSQQDRDALAILSRTIIGKQQVERDRIFGFKDGSLPPPPTSSGYWITNNRTYQAQGQGGSDLVFTTSCDPETFPLNNSGNPTAQARQRVALALSFCESTPRYPALFYIFPKEDHDHDGSSTPTAVNIWQGNAQPTTEGYISDTHISGTVNTGVTYRVVSNTTDLNNFTGVTIQPKATDFSNWVLPQGTPQNVTNANVSPNRIVVNGVVRAVGFLERVIFNGREMLPTRVMDIDLGMLRSMTHATATGGQPWLPTSGVVYAFREDAVREDAIARPAGTAGNPTNATNTSTPTDPPLVTTPEGIAMSPKQVDYIPDPDRRPHGFRLRNGSQISRNTSLGLAATDNVRGLSFFTDDTVYIQGDFNRHQAGADNTVGTRLEEFTEQLNGAFNPVSFYNRSTRDTNFARATGDRWRPSEILADALHILSDNFCDGSFQDMFITPTASAYHNPSTSTSPGYGLWGPGCATAGSNTSFRTQNLPTGANPTWLRESPGDTALTVPTTGIQINRNGQPMLSGATPYTGTYQNFATNKTTQRTAAVNTTVNTILVSGIVPSRPNQAYGGLHNFPRLLENWSGQTLQFNGSFLQLSFSNYATGPYDQDAWEPTQTPSTSENIEYYKNAPTRAWGYDPALQLAPAGPAAARFITASRNRNEFFTEVSANDAFVRQLCTAFNNTTKGGALAGAPNTVPCP